MKTTENNAEKNEGGRNKTISLFDVVSLLTQSQREGITAGYDFKNFAVVFEDESMMCTAETFLNSGMNVSAAAKKLYMHRNTLIYRLKYIYRQTGLDLRDFNMAVTFEILREFYVLK